MPGKFDLQSANHIPSNQSFNRTDHSKYQRCDPDELPIPPLYGTSVRCCYEMHAADEDESPVEGESPDRFRIVEVDVLRSIHWKRPVEAWERRSFIGEGPGIDLEAEEVAAV